MYRLIATLIWVVGIIFAKGFWSTFFAIFIPFWAWYIAVEKMLTLGGFLP
jgi:hypothetical protein